MRKIIYETNQKINNLTFLKEVKPHILPNGKVKRKALFKCSCGAEFSTLIERVISKKTQSCGCRKFETKNFTHKLREHPLYKVWDSIKQRCLNKNSNIYRYYGLRGIKVNGKWENNFLAFYNWSIKNGWSKGLTIDRINNNGNYEPANCQWLTRSDNSRKKWYDNRGLAFSPRKMKGQ